MHFIKTDELYLKNIEKYNKKDSFIACGLWFLFLVVYYFMGCLNRLCGIYIGIIINIFFCMICLIIVILKKEKLSSIGLTKKNLSKSIKFGIISGLIMVLFNGIILGLINGKSLSPIRSIISNFFYYMFIISFIEEIIFRGYIQTRINGLIKNRILSIITVAIMFMLFHVPFGMGALNIDIITYIKNNLFSLSLTFVWHIVFQLMFQRYNCIWSSTIFHGLMDWSNYLFF